MVVEAQVHLVYYLGDEFCFIFFGRGAYRSKLVRVKCIWRYVLQKELKHVSEKRQEIDHKERDTRHMYERVITHNFGILSSMQQHRDPTAARLLKRDRDRWVTRQSSHCEARNSHRHPGGKMRSRYAHANSDFADNKGKATGTGGVHLPNYE